MTEFLKTIWDKAAGVMLGLIPVVIFSLIYMYFDVQNLKKLTPLEKEVAVLKARMEHNEQMDRAQWAALRRERE